MAALRAYLRLRLLLLARLLREIGVVRLLILAPLLLLAGGRLLVVAAPHPAGRWLLPVAAAMLLASAHRQRADLAFLAVSAPAHRRWIAVEYALLVLPVAAVLVGWQAWAPAGLTLVLASGVAALPPARDGGGRQYRPRSLFRSEAFEWVSGMRRGGGLLWAVLLAVAVWQRASPLGPGLALVGWLLVLVGFYGVPEPATMVLLAARGVGPFLRRRLALGLGYAALSASPLLGLLAAGPAGWAGALAVGGSWLAVLALVILAKYAFYPSAAQIRITQALLLSVLVGGIGHPTYPALLLVLIGGLIWQSQRRLHRLLGTGQYAAS